MNNRSFAASSSDYTPSYIEKLRNNDPSFTSFTITDELLNHDDQNEKIFSMLVEALKSNQTLKKFSVESSAYNCGLLANIRLDFLCPLLDALKENTSVRHLYFYKIGFSVDEALVFANFIKTNTRLESLTISYVNKNDAVLEILAKAIVSSAHLQPQNLQIDSHLESKILQVRRLAAVLACHRETTSLFSSLQRETNLEPLSALILDDKSF